MHRLARARWFLSRVSCPVVLAGLFVAAAAGCRICPDPFDYSGPVPNGSATQNDFRARSNGTRQLNAAPHPWPPVVQAEQPSPPVADVEGTSSVLVTAGTLPADGENSVVPALNTASDRSTNEADPGAVQPAAESAEASPAEATPAGGPAADEEAERSTTAAAPSGNDAAAMLTPPSAARGAEHPPAISAVPGLAAPVPSDVETPGWRRRGPRRFE